jgi:hypothetical protein
LQQTDTSFAEARALRRYVDAVTTAIGVERTAAWHEYGPPSSAYVALSEQLPDQPDRFLMLQWNDETGWSLAIEPEGAEPPVVLAAWPEDVYLAPTALAAAVSTVLTTPMTIPLRVRHRREPMISVALHRAECTGRREGRV